MSRRATDWAWTTPARSVDLLVLLALADYADAEDRCWPKVEAVVEKTGLGRTAVKMALRRLEGVGAVGVVERGVGRHRSSIYELRVGVVLGDRPPTRKTVVRRPFPGVANGRETTVNTAENGRETTPSEGQNGRETTVSPAEKGRLATRKGSSRDPLVETPKGVSTEPVREPTTSTTTADADASAAGELVLVEAAFAPVVEKPNAQATTKAWIDTYRVECAAEPTRQQISQVGRESRALLDAGNDPARVQAAVRSAAARGYATVTREFTSLAARQRGRPSTTDQRVSAALALAESYPEEPS